MNIDKKLRREIIRLDRAGFSRVEIKNKLKIGYRKIVAVLPRQKQIVQTPAPDETAPAEWCHGCGHLVFKPCLKCYLEKLGRGEDVAPTPAELRKPLPKPLQAFLASLRLWGVVWDEDLVERERGQVAALLGMGLIEPFGPEDERGYVVAGASFRRKGV